MQRNAVVKPPEHNKQSKPKPKPIHVLAGQVQNTYGFRTFAVCVSAHGNLYKVNNVLENWRTLYGRIGQNSSVHHILFIRRRLQNHNRRSLNRSTSSALTTFVSIA